MTTQTQRHCVLCQQPVDSASPPSTEVPVPACSVYIDKRESLFTELWAWISVSTDTPLEAMCGLQINGVPHCAIATDFVGALKLAPFLEQAAKKSGERFKLVQFTRATTATEFQ